MPAEPNDQEFQNLQTLLIGKRVRPPRFANLSAPEKPGTAEDLIAASLRDDTAGACVVIQYRDREGYESVRRISLLHIDGQAGRPTRLGAFCHERHEYRSFLFSGVLGMYCPATGLVLDPMDHAMALVSRGAIKAADKGLTAIARLMVFVAACDGEFHLSEHDAIEAEIGRYFRYFGGSDETHERVCIELRRLIPDGRDALGALRTIKLLPDNRELARFAVKSCAAVMDADGLQHGEEFTVGLEISAALKQIVDKAGKQGEG